MKHLTSLFLLLFILSSVFGQSSASQKIAVDYGFSGKIDLGGKNNTSFTLSSCIGFGRQVVGREILKKSESELWGAMLSFKFGINLYRGGIGNSKLPTFFDDHQIDLFNSFALTPGFFTDENARLRAANYRRPLYTWNSNYANSLTNPWQYSLTLATNFIWNLPVNGRETASTLELMRAAAGSRSTPGAKYRRSQRLGFIGLSLGKAVSLGYYNDGPPFTRWLGDGFDRYWTGGGFVHVGSQQKLPGGDSTGFDNNNQFIFSFDKFTGYNVDAYEVANKLKLKKVPYKSYETGSFNRGIMRLAWVRNESSLFVSRVDISAGRDIQDLIHRAFNYPYHPNIYGASWVVGGQYQMLGSIHKKE